MNMSAKTTIAMLPTTGSRTSTGSSSRVPAVAGTPASRGAGIPDLPPDLASYVVYIVGPEDHLIVHVDERQKMSSPFLTWKSRLTQAGLGFSVEPVTIARLQELKQGRASVARDDGGQQTLQLARRLFQLADAAGISDIAIIKGALDTRVVVRLDGSLFIAGGDQGQYSMLPEEGTRFERSIYNGLATNKTTENATLDPRAFQDATINGDALPGTGIQNARVIRGPADPIDAGGGFLIARLQARPGAKRVIDRKAARRALKLTPLPVPKGEFVINGLRPDQIEKLKILASKPDGMIAFIGPTGSGKTSAQYKMLEYIAHTFPDRRHVTIENPPEYVMPWAIQLLAGDRSFVELLAKTLRMDPDVLMLGEIRDAPEAWAALQAALTGHLVFSTSHVKDPYRFFQRIEDMDPTRLSRRVICDHEQILGLVGLRVLPLLCQYCRQPLSTAGPGAVPEHLISALKTWGRPLDRVHIKGHGCEHCDGTGLNGRQAIAEIVITDPELMDDMRTLPVAEVKRRHRARPGVDHSLVAAATALVLSGVACPLQTQLRIDLTPSDGETLPVEETP
ncbi:ATPase, T2SS/T4P/T4SS family [Burkholderia gladioli]|uniref:ATPase, T2SS/T4P/T4SS family n=1 Tax=Burkholderia gladioli TaxID=28095 RepID=UPI00163F8023